MAVYIILDVEVLDPVGYQDYLKLSGPSVAAHGGVYIVRGGAITTLEGDWQPKRLVIVQFESEAQAMGWYHSPDYQAAKAIRDRTAKSVAILAHSLPASA